MIINEIGKRTIIEGKEYAIDDLIVCTEGMYDGKIGLIKAIRTGKDKETENPGDDICCWLFDTINDAMSLTEPIEHGACIVLAPSMIKVLNVTKPETDLRFRIIKCGASNFKAVALKEFTTVTGEKIEPGTESGLFHNQRTLTQKGTNWISADSYILDSTCILADNAYVIDSHIYANCDLSGNAVIKDSKIFSSLKLTGDSVVSDTTISYAFESNKSVVCTKESPIIHLDFGQPNLNIIVYKDTKGDLYVTILHEYDSIAVFETKKFDRDFYENKRRELLNRSHVDTMGVIAIDTLLKLVDDIYSVYELKE